MRVWLGGMMKFTKKSLWERGASCGMWVLILAVSFWSFNRNEWISTALANYVTMEPTKTFTQTQVAANGAIITSTVILYATVTHTNTTGTGTGTRTGTGSSTWTDTVCGKAGGLYGGAADWSHCTNGDPTQQKNSQDNTKDLNNDGANQSTALGMAAIAAGMAMVAAGMALMANPPTIPAGIALIAAGMALIAAGMAALAAAGKMNNNANKAGNNSNKLDNIATPYQSTIATNGGSTDTSTGTSQLGDTGNANLGDGGGSGIKIDPALLRQGKMDGIYTDMEQKTGINRDDMAKALASGANPLQLLANSPALAGKPAASADNLQKMMDDTMSKGNLPSGQEMMDKLGLSKDDLGGSGNVANAGGADPNRGLASGAGGGANGLNIDALFPGGAKGADGPGGGGNGMKLSAEVQAALDKNGITGRTIFEMVHSQYVKKAPLLFGVQKEKDGTALNPYLGTDKVDL